MNSKTLSSWMLIVAPVLFFLVFFIGWDVLVGSSEILRRRWPIFWRNERSLVYSG